MNGVHDLGGSHGFGPLPLEEDEPVFHRPWEGRVYAMMASVRRRGLFNLDEMRFAIERIAPAEYLGSGYYERWLMALERLVEEKEQAGPSGLNPPAPETEGRARWRSGDGVRAKNVNPRGHIRLPRYARGKTGVVVRVGRPRLLPDLNAELKGRVWQHVYTVTFASTELWGEQGRPDESVSLDLWEEYLEDA